MEVRVACTAIDIGNTRVKAARFEGKDIVQRRVFENDIDPTQASEWSDFLGADPVVLSSVRSIPEHLLATLGEGRLLLVIKGTTPVPFELSYNSPETLGPDRLALVAGAFGLFPGKTCLIFDAGTCITADLIIEGKQYVGGSISPGIDMRLKAMHQFTDALPLAQKENKLTFPGRNTLESLHAGAVDGAIMEVQQRIISIQQQYPELEVIITGGDAPYFVKNLKNSIFASPDLVLQGLRTILEYYVRSNY